MRIRALSLCVILALLAGCQVKGGGTTSKDDAQVVVTVTGVTPVGSTASALTSNVSSGADDLVTVAFRSTPKSVSITNPSIFFGVTLTRYRVTFSRGDGGPVPAPFDGAMSLFIPPPQTASDGTVTGGTGSTSVVAVTASAKRLSPLSTLPTGEAIFSSATLTFEGQDGFGNGLSNITGSVSVTFTNPSQ